METRTREEIAEQAPSFEELIEKIDVIIDESIKIHKNAIHLLTKWGNNDFEILLNNIFSNETTFNSIDELKTFLLIKFSSWLIYLHEQLKWKKVKMDDKYFEESNARINFERKYKKLFNFAENLYINTENEVKEVKWLVEWLL